MTPEDTQLLYMLATHSPEELERFRLEDRVRELEAAIQDAPHGRHSLQSELCDCWKSKALGDRR